MPALTLLINLFKPFRCNLGCCQSFLRPPCAGQVFISVLAKLATCMSFHLESPFHPADWKNKLVHTRRLQPHSRASQDINSLTMRYWHSACQSKKNLIMSHLLQQTALGQLSDAHAVCTSRHGNFTAEQGLHAPAAHLQSQAVSHLLYRLSGSPDHNASFQMLFATSCCLCQACIATSLEVDQFWISIFQLCCFCS